LGPVRWGLLPPVQPSALLSAPALPSRYSTASMYAGPGRLALAALAALSAEGLTSGASGAAARNKIVRAKDGHAKDGLARDGLAKDGLTPEQRKVAHLEKYEKEFAVELNMTDAHIHGRTVGVQLDTDTDFTPVSVVKIRKTGLLEEWNRANPDRAVHVGDEIMKVNDILWHHNSGTFAERIKGQFMAAKTYKEGARRVLTLAIQRPRQQREVRYESQRQDLHRQLYSKEFVANCSLVRGRDMGWELNASVDWLPVSVRKLDGTGLVALWNEEHPDFRIYPGDEIIKANHVAWHHNSKAFEGRIEAQLRHGEQDRNASNVPLSLHIRRPKSVVEELENRSFQKMFSVSVPWTDGSRPLGWTLQTDTTDPVSIVAISGDSAISAWNEANPAQRLAVGDRILKANRAQWHHNKTNFASNLRKIVDAARPRAGGPPGPHNLTLLVQRSATFSYTRGWLAEIPARVGQNLGLQTKATDDELPVTINRIRTLGAVAFFNEDTPEDALAVGDQIFKVNDILWRSDSREFQRRLNEQFAKSRRTGTLRLWVQRPAGIDPDAEVSQDYVDFSVELPVTSPKGMGWSFNLTDKQAPVSIGKVLQLGSLSDWNRENPLKDIQAGDQIMQVDDNVWHNNTRNFMQRFDQQVLAAADVNRTGGKRTLSMLFRRHFNSPSDGTSEENEKLGEGDVMGAEE